MLKVTSFQNHKKISIILYLQDILLTFFSIINMSSTYRRSIGPAANHIVTPLPSGEIRAPKIAIMITAYFSLCLQNLYSTILETVNAYITIGS